MNDSGSSFSRWARQYLPAQRWQLVLIGLFGLFAAGVVMLTLVALILTPTLPSLEDISGEQLKVPMRVYTSDGQLIAEFGEEKRIPVRIDEVPDLLIKAVLAAEDRSFFYHHGVDFMGILRAAWHNFRTQSTGQGGSTLLDLVDLGTLLVSQVEGGGTPCRGVRRGAKLELCPQPDG